MRLICGESLDVLRSLCDASVDAVITDPPYSSGGLHAGDRRRSTGSKYVQNGQTLRHADFGGDNRDQRSFGYWCVLWMLECHRILKPGGYFLSFTDWRQLPLVSDAVQAADLTWRGIISWDKGPSARAPHTGYFRHQCEYLVWASSGPCPNADGRGPFPGCFRVPIDKADKHHQCGKPVELMRELVKCVRPGGRVLDPFAGSASTGVACALEGRDFIGIERQKDYYAIGLARLKAHGQKVAA